MTQAIAGWTFNQFAGSSGNPITVDLPRSGRTSAGLIDGSGSMIAAPPIRRSRLAFAIFASTSARERPLKIAVPVLPFRALRAASNIHRQSLHYRIIGPLNILTGRCGRALPFIGNRPPGREPQLSTTLKA